MKNPSRKKFNNLIKEIADGKQDALDKFYSAYVKLIYAVAVSVSKSEFLADEIVNDVLIKIWQTAPKLVTIENPIGWVYVVTANCAKDKLNKERQFNELFDIAQDDINIENFLIKDTFLSYISPLNKEEQQIMILKFVQDLSFKTIAKVIGKPVSTVSSLYYRSIDKLKQTIKKF